jgi:hypothetical protein
MGLRPSEVDESIFWTASLLVRRRTAGGLERVPSDN